MRDGKTALEAHRATLTQTADVTHALSEIVEAERVFSSKSRRMPTANAARPCRPEGTERRAPSKSFLMLPSGSI